MRDRSRVRGTAGTFISRVKLVRLEDWLLRLGRKLADFDESVFYSDSHNDLPLLERVTRPVAVDPDEALGRIARERGWAVLSLRP